uniref:Uncharacterized protein n=1 Tax=Arundo donax TaxID=35708 RepID=A0A0A9G459_ARUDO
MYGLVPVEVEVSPTFSSDCFM